MLYGSSPDEEAALQARNVSVRVEARNSGSTVFAKCSKWCGSRKKLVTFVAIRSTRREASWPVVSPRTRLT